MADYATADKTSVVKEKGQQQQPTPDSRDERAIKLASEVKEDGSHTRSNDLEGQAVTADQDEKASYGWRFWIIFVALSITSLLTAIESTVTSTALPTIARDLNAGELYVWFVNAFFLTSTAFQPLYGQLANVFGRRWPTITAVALFALGSGISGGATTTAMLIGGRAVQGIGLGGVNMMIDIIVCDLVPLRKRGNFMGLIFAVFAIGSSIGPFVGGVLTQHVSWRWVFYIALPISGAALLLMIPFLQVEYRKEATFGDKLRRIDWIGNVTLVGSVVSILVALTYGGTIFPWSSWRTVLPLVLGFTGLILFHIYEATKFCVEPTMPPRLFANRTSLTAYLLTFLHGMLTYWVVYFLPVYFQAVLRSDATRSGVQLLPTVIILVPFAIIAGAAVTATGRYKALQISGFALMTLGIGLFTMLDAFSSTGAWVGFQILVAAGSGLIVTSSLPAAQAELPESDVATSTATWAFLRSFGSIWGVSIPAAIFNNRFNILANQIGDAAAKARLLRGSAYEYASSDFISSFPDYLQSEIINTYSGALKTVWQAAIAFAALGFILAWFEKEVELRKTLDTEYGLKINKSNTGGLVSKGAGTSEKETDATAPLTSSKLAES